MFKQLSRPCMLILKRERRLKPCRPLCKMVTCYLEPTCKNTGTLLQATSSQWKQRKHRANQQNNQKNNFSVWCILKKQAQQITNLWPFTFRYSPRPPLAGLYTTCIYKQYKGLTAVCKRRPPVCRVLEILLWLSCSSSFSVSWCSNTDSGRNISVCIFDSGKFQHQLQQILVSNWSKHTDKPSRVSIWSLTSHPVF